MSEREHDGTSSRPSGRAEDLLHILRDHDTRERIFEAYPDAVLVVDPSGSVVDLNRAAAELLGRTRDERLDLADVVRAPQEPRAGAPGTWQGPVRIRRPDGTEVEAVARSIVLPAEDRRLHLVVLSRAPTDPLSQAVAAAEEEQRRLAESERDAREAARAAEQRVARLHAIADAAVVHLSLDDLFEELLGRLRELLDADAVTVLLLDHDENVLRIRATVGLEREQEERLEVPFGMGVAGRIASERRPLIVGDLERVRAVSPFLGRRLRSLVGVPILQHDTVWGVLHVGSVRPRPFTNEDVAMLELVASRLGAAIENAELHEAERAAHEKEAKARERLQTLSEAGAAMAESLDARRMLTALVRTTSRRLADLSSAFTADRTGRLVAVVTAHTDPAKDAMLQRASRMRLPEAEDEDGIVARVLRTGAPAFEPELPSTYVDHVTSTPEHRDLVRDLRPASAIAVPLAARGRLLGVLALLRTEGSPPFTPEDLDVATELGRRAGSLLDNARLYAERQSIADTLQRSLLPPDLPEVPGLDVGARYRPAAPGTTVGGDFYDVFEIDLQHWGVVIGDVVGKGAEAAAMMGLARYTVRTAALNESRPSALLATLNDAVFRQMPESMFCTACFARIRRHGDIVRTTIASGGHPLPYVVRADGRVHTAGEPGTLLGAFEDPTLVDVVLDLEPGDAIVFYTDGVTDERRGTEEFGERRLRDLLGTLVGRTADEIASAVDVAVATFRTDVPKDDVAVLVVRVAH